MAKRVPERLGACPLLHFHVGDEVGVVSSARHREQTGQTSLPFGFWLTLWAARHTGGLRIYSSLSKKS
jgi:hypothetical protein